MLTNSNLIKGYIKRIVQYLVDEDFERLISQNLIKCISIEDIKKEIYEGYLNDNNEFTSHTVLDFPDSAFRRIKGECFLGEEDVKNMICFLNSDIKVKNYPAYIQFTDGAIRLVDLSKIDFRNRDTSYIRIGLPKEDHMITFNNLCSTETSMALDYILSLKKFIQIQFEVNLFTLQEGLDSTLRLFLGFSVDTSGSVTAKIRNILS